MKEVKNIPALRFSEFDGKWFTRSLSELLTFKNGINASKESYGSGYKFINVLDIIQNDFITHESIIGSVNVTEKEFEKNIVRYGDILFQRSSETREEVGQANVYLDKKQPATFGGFVIRGKKKADFDPSFMNYLLKTSRSRKEITTKSGGSTRYNVGQETLSKVTIQTTELPEQTKIANFLTTVDKRINLLTQQKEKLEQYKKGVMQQIFSQQIRFKDDDGNDFPDWEEKRLGETCLCLDNLRKPVNEAQRSKMKGNIPYWGANNIMDYVNDFIFDETIVLLAEDGGYFNEFKTRPIAQISYGKCWVNNHAHVLKTKGTLLTNEFLYYSLVHKNILGYVNGGTRAKLNKSDMLLIKINLPNSYEQQKITSFLSSIDKKIELVNQQIEGTKSWKKGLLQKMFV